MQAHRATHLTKPIIEVYRCAMSKLVIVHCMGYQSLGYRKLTFVFSTLVICVRVHESIPLSPVPRIKARHWKTTTADKL
jgi:hypothetical protein